MARKKTPEIPMAEPTQIDVLRCGEMSYERLMSVLHRGMHDVVDDGISMTGDGLEAFEIVAASGLIGFMIEMKNRGAKSLIIDFTDIPATGDTPR